MPPEDGALQGKRLIGMCRAAGQCGCRPGRDGGQPTYEEAAAMKCSVDVHWEVTQMVTGS